MSLDCIFFTINKYYFVALALSSVTSCERRLVVESKKKIKFDVLKKLGSKKIKSKYGHTHTHTHTHTHIL